MFRSCTNLNYVKCLATSGFDEQNTYDWLKGVAATGTFAADNDTTWPVNSTHGIPGGWTRRNPDGKAYAASDKDLLPSGVSAVAVVAYVGSAGSVETSSTYRGLAVAMSDANSGSYCNWYTTRYGSTCVSQTNNIATARGYLNGLACTETLVDSNRSGVTTHCSSHTHAAATAARSNNGTSAPTGCSNWFLPSLGQWQLIIQGLTGKSDPLTTSKNPDYYEYHVNPKITAAGGTGLDNDGYWSSTEYNNENAWSIGFGVGGFEIYDNSMVQNGAIPLRKAFARPSSWGAGSPFPSYFLQKLKYSLRAVNLRRFFSYSFCSSVVLKP